MRRASSSRCSAARQPDGRSRHARSSRRVRRIGCYSESLKTIRKDAIGSMLSGRSLRSWLGGGQNVQVDYRWAGGDLSACPDRPRSSSTQAGRACRRCDALLGGAGKSDPDHSHRIRAGHRSSRCRFCYEPPRRVATSPGSPARICNRREMAGAAQELAPRVRARRSHLRC